MYFIGDFGPWALKNLEVIFPFLQKCPQLELPLGGGHPLRKAASKVGEPNLRKKRVMGVCLSQCWVRIPENVT